MATMHPPQHGPILSVIIPFGPGEAEGAPLLESLAALPNGTEVLLLGRPPDTAPPPAWPGHVAWRPLPLSGRRAGQMNAGARLAHGRWLWFLHADTVLTPAALPAACRFIARPGPAIGWFDLAFRPDGPALTRLNAWGANRRSRWLGLPFGDQGLLMPRQTFQDLGGYDETAPYGEDHLLVWSAHGARIPVRPVGAALSTSARKYATRGWWPTTRLHLRLTLIQAFAAWRRNQSRAKR